MEGNVIGSYSRGKYAKYCVYLGAGFSYYKVNLD